MGKPNGEIYNRNSVEAKAITYLRQVNNGSPLDEDELTNAIYQLLSRYQNITFSLKNFYTCLAARDYLIITQEIRDLNTLIRRRILECESRISYLISILWELRSISQTYHSKTNSVTTTEILSSLKNDLSDNIKFYLMSVRDPESPLSDIITEISHELGVERDIKDSLERQETKTATFYTGLFRNFVTSYVITPTQPSHTGAPSETTYLQAEILFRVTNLLTGFFDSLKMMSTEIDILGFVSEINNIFLNLVNQIKSADTLPTSIKEEAEANSWEIMSLILRFTQVRTEMIKKKLSESTSEENLSLINLILTIWEESVDLINTIESQEEDLNHIKNRPFRRFDYANLLITVYIFAKEFPQLTDLEEEVLETYREQIERIYSDTTEEGAPSELLQSLYANFKHYT